MNGRWNPAKALLVWGIRGYQAFVSPALPRSCKYHPSCSQYALDALTQYGVLRGVVLASWRLARCNPLSYGGYDPIERQTLFAPRGGRDLGARRTLFGRPPGNPEPRYDETGTI